MGYMTLLLKYVNTAQLMWAVNKLLFSSTVNAAKTHSSQNYGYCLYFCAFQQQSYIASKYQKTQSYQKALNVARE